MLPSWSRRLFEEQVMRVRFSPEGPARLAHTVELRFCKPLNSVQVTDWDQDALVLELAYRLDLKSSAERIVGSTPTWSTNAFLAQR